MYQDTDLKAVICQKTAFVNSETLIYSGCFSPRFSFNDGLLDKLRI